MSAIISHAVDQLPYYRSKRQVEAMSSESVQTVEKAHFDSKFQIEQGYKSLQEDKFIGHLLGKEDTLIGPHACAHNISTEDVHRSFTERQIGSGH